MVPAVQSKRENQEEETYAGVDREEVWISTEDELRPSTPWKRRGAASKGGGLIDDDVEA